MNDGREGCLCVHFLVAGCQLESSFLYHDERIVYED
jgi:hypothetical protein